MLYIVQPGDTLYAIAARYNVTVEAILAANVICNPGLILIQVADTGQRGFIPRVGFDEMRLI